MKDGEMRSHGERETKEMIRKRGDGVTKELRNAEYKTRALSKKSKRRTQSIAYSVEIKAWKK